MKSKVKANFYEPGCSSCDFLKVQGAFPCETRYCTNLPRKRAKRFRSKDPVIKAPAWCPKRKDPPLLQVYGFCDEFSKKMELVALPDLAKPRPEFTHPNRRHYQLRLEKRIGMKAKDFYMAVQKNQPVECLQDLALEEGEVIGIDSGLASFYFQYLGANAFARVLLFEQIVRNEQPEPGADGTGGRSH